MIRARRRMKGWREGLQTALAVVRLVTMAVAVPGAGEFA
jgi:hypothetical protein